MISSENFKVLDEVRTKTTHWEVVAHKSIVANAHPAAASYLHYMDKVGVHYKQVRCKMNNTAVRLEAGALHFLRGDITLDSDLGNLGKMFKRGLAALSTGEPIVKPLYKGTGDLYLEPTFGHFLLIDLQEGDELVTDDGMFFACDESVKITAVAQKSLAAGFFGGEGWVQPKFTGPGAVVLESKVPFEELVRVELNNDVLKVDGSFAVARFGDISFTVEKSTRSMLGSAASGEGLLQVFRGTGQVWLNPLEGLRWGG